MEKSMESEDTPVIKNSYCRKIRIENFRNVGITKPTEITLNRSLDVERLGGLVILVGQSGTGKSNILDAVETLGKNQKHSDYPDFIDDADNGLPVVRLEYFDGTPVSPTFQGGMQPGNSFDWGKVADTAGMESVFKSIISLLSRDYGSPTQKYLSVFNGKPEIEQLCEIGDHIASLPWNDLKASLVSSSPELFKSYVSIVKEALVGSKNELPFEIKYGFSPDPIVVRYQQRNITGKDLLCPCDQLNPFMIKLLSQLLDGNGVAIVKSAYEKYRRDGNISKLDKTESKLNKDVQRFADSFNRLYMNHGIGYSFKIRLLDARIGFSISLGDEPKVIDKESTGFRWFFDFFFNMLCSNNLNRGDIVIMDEPGTNLHVSAQIELRKFIREFAIKQGITFLLSTHSPFLIDCDYLDEIRIVSRVDDRESKVFDKYTVVNPDSPDQMDPILSALTVGRHVMFNPEDKVYFVEGITDYNYLTAFKIKFGITGMTFLPINGLGGETDDSKRKGVIRVLMKLDRNPVLIVDGDGAGKAMSDIAEGTGLSVLKLTDVDKKFTCIEKLFTPEDREKFIPTKEWHSSSIFKQYVSENTELSEETVANFKKLFDRLED